MRYILLDTDISTTSDCSLCNDNWLPVCCDGVEYGNKCEAECFGCNFTTYYESQCRPNCTLTSHQLCSSTDGILYEQGNVI